jgi:hypothetical protein
MQLHMQAEASFPHRHGTGGSSTVLGDRSLRLMCATMPLRLIACVALVVVYAGCIAALDVVRGGHCDETQVCTVLH